MPTMRAVSGREITRMSPTVELEQIDEVPSEARVYRYDELAPPAKHQLSTLADRGTPTDEVAHVQGFSCRES